VVSRSTPTIRCRVDLSRTGRRTVAARAAIPIHGTADSPECELINGNGPAREPSAVSGSQAMDA
jgi:hypothetical protein